MPGDPVRLLSSWPESRGLHAAGALTRPREEKDKVVAGRSGPTAQQSARISGATPSGCADTPPRGEKTREEFCPAVSSRQKKKGVARRLAAWPVEPDRPGEGFTQRVRRRAPRVPSRAPRAPAVFDDLRLGYTKINVSSSPAYFFTARARITPSDARGLSPHFITVASLFAPAPARVGPGAGRLA